MIRPEYVRIEEHGTTGENRIPGMVEAVVYLGFHQDVRVRLATGALVHADVPNDGDAPEYAQGDAVAVHLRPRNLQVLAADEAGVTAGTAAAEEAVDRRRGRGTHRVSSVRQAALGPRAHPGRSGRAHRPRGDRRRADRADRHRRRRLVGDRPLPLRLT